jgi:hypothetical protein
MALTAQSRLLLCGKDVRIAYPDRTFMQPHHFGNINDRNADEAAI